MFDHTPSITVTNLETGEPETLKRRAPHLTKDRSTRGIEHDITGGLLTSMKTDWKDSGCVVCPYFDPAADSYSQAFALASAAQMSTSAATTFSTSSTMISVVTRQRRERLPQKSVSRQGMHLSFTRQSTDIYYSHTSQSSRPLPLPTRMRVRTLPQRRRPRPLGP